MEKQLEIVQVAISELKSADYNPRKWDESAIKQLSESIKRFGLVDPIIVNKAPNRKNVVIGGHFRLKVTKDLGYKEIPVVYVNIPDIEKEKELNLRLNKNTGEWDWKMLADFDESFLADIGWSSEELDDIFEIEDTPEQFDLQKELQKLDITQINIQKGDVWKLGENKLMCGDSTVEEDVLKLMGEEKADMSLTDPPYILDYLRGKKNMEKQRKDLEQRETEDIWKLMSYHLILRKNGWQILPKFKRNTFQLLSLKIGKTSEPFGTRWKSIGKLKI